MNENSIIPVEKNKHGFCETCGASINGSYCCNLCDTLAANNVRALVNGKVLINSVPCGTIYAVYDEANKSFLYYGTLDSLPNWVSEVYSDRSLALNALYNQHEYRVEILPE